MGGGGVLVPLLLYKIIVSSHGPWRLLKMFPAKMYVKQKAPSSLVKLHFGIFKSLLLVSM